MWTLFPYDDALKDYFRKTLAQNVYTRRLIDTAHAARADIADHLWESRESIASGNYRVYLVNNVSFEVLIVDHGEAAVFHYPRRGFSCLFARHQERQFVTVVHGIFEQLCEQSTPLPDTAVATKASLDAWLHANG
jgi:hypothetical protein